MTEPKAWVGGGVLRDASPFIRIRPIRDNPRLSPWKRLEFLLKPFGTIGGIRGTGSSLGGMIIARYLSSLREVREVPN